MGAVAAWPIASPEKITVAGPRFGECSVEALLSSAVGLRFREPERVGRQHPSSDVIFSGQNLANEPLKHVFLASCDVIISGQICGSKLQSVFTLGDRRWLPKGVYLQGLNAQADFSTDKLDCPVQWSLALGLEKSVQSQPELSSRKSHLQVQGRKWHININNFVR